jgi:hypothetical protein
MTMLSEAMSSCAYIPEFVEDEALYGWVSRYHRLSGNAYTIKSSMNLFGDEYSAFRIGFPSQLDHFTAVTGGVLGDAESLANSRSLLKFFRPFISEEVAGNAVRRMRCGSIKPLRAELGIFANRIGSFNWLKACPDCMRYDLKAHHATTWHRDHQWPVAWVCRKHRRYLRVARKELFPERHTQLLLPQDIGEAGWDLAVSGTAAFMDKLCKVQEFVEFFSTREESFDRQCLRYTYLVGVRNLGLIRTDGAVKAELWDAFRQHYAGIWTMSELKYGKLKQDSQDFVFQLMRQDDYRHHPIRHFLLMAFLFESPGEFCEAYDQVGSAISDAGLDGVRELLSSDYRQELRRLIEQEGLTIQKAAKSLNVTFTQAKNLIEATGITYRKRYDLPSDMAEKLQALICAGDDRKVIAQAIGVDLGFLKYYFKKNPRQNEIWKERHFVRARDEARAHYRVTLSQLGTDVTVSELLKRPKSTFWWLRMHDIDWLEESSPHRVRTVLLENRGVSDMSNPLSDMFGFVPAFLPQIEDGETLYSWAAGYHRLSGNALAKESSLQLFGDSRAGLRHDFPSHLDHFVKNTNGVFGDAGTLAYERTIFGFFAPFQDQRGAEDVLSLMRGISVEKVKSTLGLLPSRVGGFFPLKACPDCIKTDLKANTVSRWHVEHQWPSTWICRKHRKPLQALKRECQPKDLRKWLLPEDVSETEWDKFHVTDSAKSKLSWIAELSAHVSKNRSLHLDHQLLRYTYLCRAKERGWLSTDGSLKLAEVRTLFLDYYAGMDGLPGYEVVRSVEAEHGGMLGMLMRQYDWKRHPLKHLLLIAFMFDTVSEFDETYQQVWAAYTNGGLDALKMMVGESWKAELKRLVEVDLMSLSGAARAIGIPLSVAIRVAKQEGVAYQRRARVLNTVLGDEIMDMIAGGLSRDEIQQRTGIKKTLLKDLLAREPTLRDAWRKMDFDRRKDGYRANFLALIDQYRGVPVKRLRLLSGNGVSWLYRNDRAWLGENLPNM